MPEFTVTTHQGRIQVTRQVAESQPSFMIDLTPAEADRATHLVGLALSMIELDNVPDHITNTPFVVRFYENQVFALERSDISGSLPFRTKEGDELIKAIHMGVGMALNEQAHGRAVAAVDTPFAHVPDSEPM